MRSAEGGEDGGPGNWLELLRDGLTFDLLGLDPGPSLTLPDIAYRFSCPVDLHDQGLVSIGLFPGPHLAEGASSLPVVRTMLSLGAELVQQLPDVAAVCWTPARSAIAPSLFARLVDSWTSGGPFPALGLVGFSKDARGRMVTEGLGFLIGQEIEMDEHIAADPVAATRTGARLVHELVGMGGLSGPLAVNGADGTRLRLEPQGQSRPILVSIA